MTGAPTSNPTQPRAVRYYWHYSPRVLFWTVTDRTTHTSLRSSLAASAQQQSSMLRTVGK